MTPPTTANRRQLDATNTKICLTLIRLVEQDTDIVITLNVPSIPDSEGQQQQAADNEEMMESMCREVLTSFEIKNWELFDA